MGFFGSLGRKLKGAQAFGAKLLRGAGSIGQKITSGASSALDTLEGIPGVGGALKNVPFYNTMRGVISGGAALGKLADTAGQALERPITSADDLMQRGKELAASGKEAVAQVKGMRKRRRNSDT